jgi:hypothetical protein
VLIRVQHIDGSLEPPVEVGDGELLYEAGTTFALPDGRWVRTIAFERERDGSVRYGIVGELPDKRIYSARGNEAYVRDAGEMRMGSPQYGTLVLDGTPLDVGGPVDEASLDWSQDGRYLAATVLDPANPYPWTKVIVVDAQARDVVGATEGGSGLYKPGEFLGRGLEYFRWEPDADYPDWGPGGYLAF